MNKKKYFLYLDNLRESGVTNMFGAVPYLTATFSELTEREAKNILIEWMKTFNERHKKENN